MVPQDFLKDIATKHGVSGTELEALSLALEGKSTTMIASTLEISVPAVRKRLSEVYQKFHIGGKGPVKLTQLQQMLVACYHQQVEPDLVVERDLSVHPNQDLSAAPDVSVFYGRKQELKDLRQGILADGCRLVAIAGMAGIGKTALSVKLAQEIGNQFEYVIWRSLRSLSHVPPLKELLTDLIQSLSHQTRTYSSDSTDEKISWLIDHLHKHRCLLILDNFETVLEDKKLAGHYRQGYDEYREFIKRVGEDPHRSCLVITSLEQPDGISALAGDGLPVRSIKLHSLGEAAGEILKAKGLKDEDKWKTLIDFYRGNPLALKLVSTTIIELFDGKVAEFLKRNSLVFGEIRDLLDRQFDRLSDLEQHILDWLASQTKAITLPTPKDIYPDVSASKLLDPSDLIGAMESLVRRSLIEKQNSNNGVTLFILQPVVMEYVNKRLKNHQK